MSAHCPQDGGFVGAAGCTHPRRAHSPLVKKILAGKIKEISAEEADAALSEGFYVDGANGRRIGFGKPLKRHLERDHQNAKDIVARKTALLQAVETVKHPDCVEWQYKRIRGRTAYAKAFSDRGILAITDREGENIECVFNIIPKRSLKRRLPR
mgnify:CR=1 FL=1